MCDFPLQELPEKKKVKTIILLFWRHVSLKLDSLGICNKPKCRNEEKAPFKAAHLGDHATGNPLALFNTSKQQINPEYNTCTGR